MFWSSLELRDSWTSGTNVSPAPASDLKGKVYTKVNSLMNSVSARVALVAKLKIRLYVESVTNVKTGAGKGEYVADPGIMGHETYKKPSEPPLGQGPPSVFARKMHARQGVAKSHCLCQFLLTFRALVRSHQTSTYHIMVIHPSLGVTEQVHVNSPSLATR
jgi:hypothetical protein